MTATLARGREVLRSPQVSGGAALIVASGLTTALGLPYWLIAARRYDAVDVGIGSALVAAMTLLSSLATSGLKRSLIRYVPEAGTNARRLVGRVYAVAVVASVVLSVGFVAGVGLWSPELRVLHDEVLVGALFVVGVAAWGVFQLQDSVLVAVRRSWMVPAENLAFSVAKIGLLVVLGVAAPTVGVFLSWAVPALVAAVAVNSWLVATRAAPPSVEGATEPTRRELTRFAGAEHVASLLWSATVAAAPLLVLSRRGAEANAAFFVALQVANFLFLVASNVGDVMVAEGAMARSRLGPVVRKAAWQVAAVVGPGAIALVVLAPWVLGAFGGEYREAAGLLSLLALASVPHAAVALLVGVAQVRGRMGRVVAVQAAICVATLGGSWLALGVGLTAMGWVWLVTQVLAAAGLVAVVVREEPGLLRPVHARLFRAARSGAGRVRRRRTRPAVEAVLARVPADLRGEGPWEVAAAHDGGAVLVAEDDGPVVRVATRARGIDVLEAHVAASTAIHADPRLAEVRTLVPPVLASAADGTWAVEEQAVGVRADGLTGVDRAAAVTAAVAAVGRVHEATAAVVRADDDWLDRWVAGPGRVVAAALDDGRVRARLATVLASLRSDLAGRSLTVARTHGSLALGDVLLAPDGRVTALVDWEASTVGLPEVDLAHLALAERREAAGGEMGPHVVAMVTDGLDRAERVARAGAAPFNIEVPDATVVVLAWLHHAAAHLRATRPGPVRRWWVRRNVTTVLAALARTLGPATPAAPVDAAAPAAATPVDAEAPVTAAALAPARAGGDDGDADEDDPAARRPPPTLLLGTAAVALWAGGLWGADPGRMTDLGLLSLLGPANVVALAVLLLAFGLEVARPRPDTWRLATPVVLFTAFVHGTPAALYGTLRYAWAWKHVGIVDYIDRHGTVDPGIATLDVYHNWPGFFSQVAAVLDLAGIDDPTRILRWWPLAIELLTIPVLVFVFRALGTDRRVTWTATLFTMTANWVGQDYFSPQSEAFLLYLVLIGVVLARLPQTDVRHRWEADLPAPAPWPLGWTWALIGVLLVAIASSHQVTPFMVAVALGALLLTRRARTGRPLVAAVVVAVAWAFTGARTFVVENLRALVGSVGRPVDNAGANLVDAGQLSPHQQLVSTMGRVTVAAIALLAGVAIVRQLWSRRVRVEAVALAVSPVLMVLASSFDGEIVFRTYLFALPFLAWLAADGIWGTRAVLPPSAARRARRGLAVVVVAAVLLSGFAFGYFGKDQWYRFSDDEIAAADLVQSDAAPGSLLVTATGNYPVQFADYENLTYVPFAIEPQESRDAVLADPAGELSNWLSDPAYADAYVLLTRSQRGEAEATGTLPDGALAAVEEALRADPRFATLYDSPDAVVFVLR